MKTWVLANPMEDWTGMNGVHYVLEIFIADNSRLQNRLIWFALTSMPYVVNSFIGPYLGQAFLDHSTWRWGCTYTLKVVCVWTNTSLVR